MEEKYGKTNGAIDSDGTPSEDESSTDESEDDGALLATHDVDTEIMDTLKAIRSRDPRIYDASKKFYKDFEPDLELDGNEKKEKPMYLHDYHRKNILESYTGDNVDEEEQNRQQPFSHLQEQEALKKQIIQEMHATYEDGSNEIEQESDDDGGNMDEFLKAKPSQKDKPSDARTNRISTSAPDPSVADHDPETFLSNFMSARAWVPDVQSRWQPFDSDDSEDEARADTFEEAYNMRFEDPEHSNEKLMSHARDVASKYSVRREEPKGRKKARGKERIKKDEAKREREEEKARLRKLRIENAEEKLKRIKEAAGLKITADINLAEWKQFLDEGWDDEKWEAEMKKRFGESYYAESDGEGSGGDKGTGERPKQDHKKKPRKPQWNDDIEINDLIPDYEDKEANRPQFTLTDDEDANADDPPSTKSKSKKDRLASRAEAKRASRLQRREIEDLVDTSLSTDPTFMALSNASKSQLTSEVPRFRYRDTSPTTFGLTPRDILLASDAQLNQFAGLKKLSSFRDPVKKRRDRKSLGKKARLREWRRETFGDVEGPKGGFRDNGVEKGGKNGPDGSEQVEKKKKKRGKKKQGKTVVE